MKPSFHSATLKLIYRWTTSQEIARFLGFLGRLQYIQAIMGKIQSLQFQNISLSKFQIMKPQILPNRTGSFDQHLLRVYGSGCRYSLYNPTVFTTYSKESFLWTIDYSQLDKKGSHQSSWLQVSFLLLTSQKLLTNCFSIHRQDSVVSDKINFDLLTKMTHIQEGSRQETSLLGQGNNSKTKDTIPAAIEKHQCNGNC